MTHATFWSKYDELWHSENQLYRKKLVKNRSIIFSKSDSNWTEQQTAALMVKDEPSYNVAVSDIHLQGPNFQSHYGNRNIHTYLTHWYIIDLKSNILALLKNAILSNPHKITN